MFVRMKFLAVPGILGPSFLVTGWGLLGPVYMSRASPDTRAGPLRRDDFQPGFI